MFENYKDDISCVLLFEWNDDPKSHAKLLNTMGVTKALVYAYSWGAGFGLREFSKPLKGKYRCSKDPVFRSKFLWMRWRALTKN